MSAPASPCASSATPFALASAFSTRRLHVVLVAPEIHWNTGNAGRSCLAAGAQLHLVRPLGFSLEDRYLRRAGLDYWPRVQPVVWDDLGALEEQLQGVAEPRLFAPDAERSLWDARFTAPAVLVFGRESTGLPRSLRERHRDRLLRIPMAEGAVRSLNLSTAVGVALFEALRQLDAR